MGAEQKGLWGWFPAGNVWVKMQVAATGKLVIDPTAIFEEPPTNGEMGKAATSNWSFDHNADPNAHHARQHAIDAAADHTGRIALTQMTLGGAGLVLTGQGAGDPIYAAAAGGIPTVVFKTADETVNNSNVLQNDDELLLAIAANEVWAFEINLYVSGNTTADFKAALVIPALATMLWAYIWDGSANFDACITASGASNNINLPGAGTYGTIKITGCVFNGANAGNLQLQWAQVVATVVDTTVKKGSCLVAYKKP